MPVLFGWIWARLLVLLVEVVYPIAGRHLEHPTDPLAPIGLLRWDAAYYRVIAESWYQGVDSAGARFFPVYPALGRAIAPLLGGRVDLALILIANATAFLGALVLWRLVAEVVGASAADDRAAAPSRQGIAARLSATAADRSAWMVAIVPSAFVFVWAYTEGLALLLGAAALLALHRRAWWSLAIFVFLAAALRPVGGLLLIAILVQWWPERSQVPWYKAATAIAAPFVGLATSFVWIERTTGDLLLPLRAQQAIRGGFQDPLTRVLEPIGEVLTGNFRDIYNLAFMVVLIWLLVVAVQRRQPASWIAFAGASLLLTLSAQVTDSIGRYALVVVPFVAALAQWADRRWRQVVVASVGSAGLVWMASEAMLIRLVP